MQMMMFEQESPPGWGNTEAQETLRSLPLGCLLVNVFFRHLFHSPSRERHLVFEDKGKGRRERMSCPCRMASQDGQPTGICSVSPEAPLPGASRVGMWTVAMTTKVLLKLGTWAGCSVLGTSPVGGGSQPGCCLKNPVGDHCLCPSPEDWGPWRGLPALKSTASICFGKQLCSTTVISKALCVLEEEKGYGHLLEEARGREGKGMISRVAQLETEVAVWRNGGGPGSDVGWALIPPCLAEWIP